MWYNFPWQTDKMSVDEIVTLLLIEKMIADTLMTKANFTAKIQTNGLRYTRIRNSQVCEIIKSFLP